MISTFLLAAAAASLSTAQARVAPEPAFLDFPYVDAVSAAKVPAFAWIVRQGDRTSLLYARAPEFRRLILATRSDEDGQPITDVQIAPDGAHLVYITGAARGMSRSIRRRWWKHPRLACG
jgi:hypothetical protein